MRVASERRHPHRRYLPAAAGLDTGGLKALPYVLCLAVILAMSPVFAQAPAPADNWTQFRGNSGLTGVAASAPPATPTVRWTFEAGEAIDASPAIVDGVVYVASSNGDLLAIDLMSGQLRWKYATGGMIGESSPAVGNGAVFFGDLGGTVHAVDVRDGKRLWTFKTDGEVKSSPTIADDIVLIGSYDTHLYALDSRTGKVRWKVQTNGPVHATAAVHDGIVYITGCDENFRALRLANGAAVFTIPTGAYTGASPLVAANRAYFGTFNYEVLGVDLRTKKIAWRYRNPNREFPFYASAAMRDGTVIVGGRDKLVHAIDAATGKAAWTFAARARIDSSPAIAAGRVYVGSNDGRLYGLDARTGKKEWEFDAGAPIAASPAIAASRIVIGTQDGRVYCFG
ncbi:MAG: serine/threonine protein kinase [Blastocatellia bacterium]|nr:MAG: serine/threonine protein kinase [Blastocatellia bacterium]